MTDDLDAGLTAEEIAFKHAAEASLYVFVKGVLERTYLTPALHLPFCDSLQQCPPQRKLKLYPREHCKTSIISHGLPIHILIQRPETNCYFPGEWGYDQRIILAGETEKRAMDAMRVIQDAFEMNAVLRKLWSHVCFDKPKREAKKWNESEMIIRRPREYPDPSIRAIGVDGAIAGSHPTVMIKDDLISFKAMNSPTVMQTAIDWHVTSRALINRDECLEFILGTRYTANDLYQYIIDNDPTVDVETRSIVEDGVPIYPEVFPLEKVARLQKEFGVLFPLLYMNSATDRELTDFDLEMLREFTVRGTFLEFEEDPRDLVLAEKMAGRVDEPPPKPGTPITTRDWHTMYQPGQGFRLRG